MDENSNRIKPLIIYKLNGIIKDHDLQRLADQITKSFETGCFVCDARCSIIAFDDRGRLVYKSEEA